MAIQPIACHRRRRTRYLLAGVCPVGIIDGMEFGGAVGGSCERVERRSSTFSFMLYFGGQVRVLFLEAFSGLDICWNDIRLRRLRIRQRCRPKRFW